MSERKSLSLEEQQQIVDLYKSGLTRPMLREQFGFSHDAIKRALSKHKVKPHSNMGNLSDEQKESVLKDYRENGLRSLELAKIYGVSQGKILIALKEFNVRFTFGKKRITGEQERLAVAAYSSGKSTTIICKELGFSQPTILNTLANYGVPLRNTRDMRPLEGDLKAKMIETYLSGESLENTALQFGYTMVKVRNMLLREGVPIRTCLELNTKRWQDPEARKKMTDGIIKNIPRGVNHKGWKGGRTPLRTAIRQSRRYIQWRKAVFSRDNHLCIWCKKKPLTGNHIEADHIYPFSKILDDHGIGTLEQALACSTLWDTNNGRTLCKECHKKTDTYGAKVLTKAT